MTHVAENEIDVKALRESRGMTQAELAAYLDLDQSTISLWEKKKANPRGPARKLLQQMIDAPQEPV